MSFLKRLDIIFVCVFVFILASCSGDFGYENFGSDKTLQISNFVEKISSGGGHTCAVSIEDGVVCWGQGDSGQLGDGKSLDSPFPVDVVDGADTTISLSRIKGVSSGEAHTCALSEEGGVFCWGKGRLGQLGNNKVVDSPIPVTVSDFESGEIIELSGVLQISAGGSHTCALKEGGSVLCWGSGQTGQLGDNKAVDSPTPVAVVTVDEDNNNKEIELNGIFQVSAGNFHTCALKEGGGVLCWGSGRAGQLGDNKAVDSLTPVAVVTTDATDVTTNKEVELSRVIQLSLGNAHTCALKDNGSVLCWGSGQAGQLGDNKSIGSRVPVTVVTASEANSSEIVELRGITQISVGNDHSCALLGGAIDTDDEGIGRVFCWGDGSRGQLGYPLTSSSLMSSMAFVVLREDTEEPPLNYIKEISAGDLHTCALESEVDEDGLNILCWGAGDNGRLGRGSVENANEDSDFPVEVEMSDIIEEPRDREPASEEANSDEANSDEGDGEAGGEDDSPDDLGGEGGDSGDVADTTPSTDPTPTDDPTDSGADTGSEDSSSGDSGDVADTTPSADPTPTDDPTDSGADTSSGDSSSGDSGDVADTTPEY